MVCKKYHGIPSYSKYVETLKTNKRIRAFTYLISAIIEVTTAYMAVECTTANRLFLSFTCMFVSNGLDFGPFQTVKFQLNLVDLPRTSDKIIISNNNLN